MQFAPQFKHAHFEYCSNHAKFVHLVEKYKLVEFFILNFIICFILFIFFL